MTTMLTPILAPPSTPARANAWMLWRVERPEEPAQLSVAELTECLCPDLCNRDHDNE